MVYCGKPSKSCHACRSRKTKCDQIPTGCTQCKRAKRPCPGYRVPTDLLFRNENSNVIRKSKASSAQLPVRRHPPKIASPASSSEEEEVEIIPRQDDSLTIFSLGTTLSEVAVKFFVSNYVLGLENTQNPRPQLDFVLDITRSNNFDDSLLHSMRAVGLAGLSHVVREPSLMRNARYEYVKACEGINRLLGDKEGRQKDGTLLAIMVVGTFEVVSGGEERSIKDWEGHLKGAAEVIRLRGPSQVRTMAGRRMLLQTATSLLISCIRRAMPFPPHIRELIHEACAVHTMVDPAIYVQSAMMEFCSLRHLVRFRKMTDPTEIMERCLALDRKVVDLVDPCPPGWECELIDLNRSKGKQYIAGEYAWRGKYHIYAEPWRAQVWNAIRTMRIMLNEMLRKAILEGMLNQLPDFVGEECQTRLAVCQMVLLQMQDDVLWSVPQHIGFENMGSFAEEIGKTPDRMMEMWKAAPSKGKIRQGGGTFLVWPLSLVAMMDIASPEVASFCVKALRGLEIRLGIKQAGVLATMIEGAVPVDSV